MRNRLQFLTVVTAFIIVITGCSQRISADETPAALSVEKTKRQVAEKEDFGCFPPFCSSIPDANGQKICEDWKAGRKVEWPPDCNYLPTEECRKLCKKDNHFLEDCKKYTLPPDCGFIPEQEKKLLCEKCKQIFPELDATQQIGQPKEDGRNIISGIPSCSDKKEFFTVSHIPISELQNIVPLGNLNPSGHTFPTNHLYFHLKGFSGVESSPNAQVVAPGNIWITRIGSSEYTMKERQIKDYKLDFTVCMEVRGYFIHIASLSEKLLQSFAQPDNCKEYDTGGIHYKNCEKDFYFSPISVAGGESIGTVGGSSDFGLADLRTQELVYANPKRWYEDPLHRVCPLDYFSEGVGMQLKSLLGSSDIKRTVEPICGEVAQDKPGTAQGVWFVKGTSNTYPEDPHLALVHDNIDPEKGVFSVGASINELSSGTYSFNPGSSGLVNRDFKNITADGKVYCYEAQGGRPYTQYVVVILQLTSSTTLRIEKQNSNICGNGPWAFSSNYVDFER